MDNETLIRLLREAGDIVIEAFPNSYDKNEFRQAAFVPTFNILLYKWQNEEIARQMRMNALAQGSPAVGRSVIDS